MAEWRPAPWRKIWGDFVSSKKLRGIGSDARSILATMIAGAWWDDESPEGRMYLAEGVPTSLSELLTEAECSPTAGRNAWAKLERLKVVGVVDGCLALLRFGRHQATSTKRVRALRERRWNADETQSKRVELEAEAEVELEEQEQRLREQARSAPPSPPVESKPKGKPRKPRTDYPAGLEEHFLDELQRACRDFRGRQDAGPRAVTNGMRDMLRKLYAAEAPSCDDITRAVRRRLELNRQGDTYGDLTWEHLCREASFRRYRDAMPVGEQAGKPGADEVPAWLLEEVSGG